MKSMKKNNKNKEIMILKKLLKVRINKKIILKKV